MPHNNKLSRSPFRHRDFRIFWTGSFVSSIGTQFTTVAMAWQIYELTNLPFQIGLLGLARALPQIVLLLFAGLLADPVNERPAARPIRNRHHRRLARQRNGRADGRAVACLVILVTVALFSPW